ncbi:DNA-directed DNA polymerase [Malassezia cuniculi]|uniref:DNA polymerase epsilon catalytic subunit n=1 Tax=Malassezia cuniculi TaxID=948313 RepID=A0AAF0ET86_9BASI|nr:DNA-directed DNA polymerase [Malassezia cuniculi]
MAVRELGNPRGGRGRGRGTFRRRSTRDNSRATEASAASAAAERLAAVRAHDELDESLGFARLEQGETRQAWMVNMHPTLLPDDEHPGGRSAVDYYFVQDDASMFKVTVPYMPYFLLGCKPGTESSVEEWLRRRFEGVIHSIERRTVDDLRLPNHLVGNKRLVMALRFRNVNDLLAARRELLPIAQEAQRKVSAVEAYANVMYDSVTTSDLAEYQVGVDTGAARGRAAQAAEQSIVGLWEYDVPYYLRVAIDNDIRVGLWYDVSFEEGVVRLDKVPERVKRADPVVMAFDIETTKQPLKFPDARSDVIMMISYMIDGHGFLITNREVISEDIEDFEYTPKDDYPGPFMVFNEPDEKALLERFISHIQEARPTVIATYNGDSFDFPFVDARAQVHGISLFDSIGFARDSDDEYKSRTCSHLDCFRWVKRDSYLPQGSQGLKAVTVAKLGYDPMELDPELMTPYASEQPQTLAQYSVSDAVATYYLYMKYVHPFIFSLCNIIPLNPDEVLRKGSGTLCETLLMVQAYKGGILMPNRHTDPIGRTFEGHMLESETYVGGHVEALEAGVFRSDIPTDFRIEPAAMQQLIDDLDASLKFSIVEEGNLSLGDVVNYDEVYAQIRTMLEALRDSPVRQDKPLIYHLDVAAMYPNIMLSNRLQPDSVVDQGTCASCDYNRPGMQCDKRMQWAWRGEYFPAKRDEINMIRHALDSETFPGRDANAPPRSYADLSPSEQAALLQKRLADYSRKVYKRTHDTKTVVREAIICQRENPFYINTVRDFRDRRYEYKGLHKTWKKKLDQADGVAAALEAKNMIVLYDSLQLAHKCILNSFYGYVMRKGARWYSMEMAGITCLTGATIIQMAKELVDRIGRPLELDTDGIWCMLPGSFPENFSFKTKNGKSFGVSYPCTMLNYLVHARFTNHQYHDLVDGTYRVHSENSIFFELDGPYRAMILPSSKEEDKLLKKRYAVFNEDGSLAELKGFEVKRRGELQLIKDFQKQIFSQFLLGDTLVGCYAAVARVADQWLDVLYSKGATLADSELIDLIAENKSMSKMLSEYGSQKSTAITTARRLADILGQQMVKDKGLACKFIVSAKPYGAPVTDRAVPVAIFNAEPDVKQHFLRRFLKDNSLVDFDLRSILDWDYYIERFAGVIQKLITIPAAMQKVPNPVPRVRHPDWLLRRVSARDDRFVQSKLSTLMLSDAVKARTRPPKAAETLPEPQPQPEPEPAAESEPQLMPVPDINVDYPGWVSAMRERWRRRRAERKTGAVRPSTLGSIFQQQSTAMASSNWDVVQVCPAARAGEFRLWVLAGTQLQSLKLRVPRQFYVNFKHVPERNTFLPDYIAEPVTRTLPRGHAVRHLVRITVAEDVYLENEAHFSALLNHPSVDGVYELQVPLDMRAVLQLGAACGFRRDSGTKFSRALDAGIDLGDLRPSGAHTNYLFRGRALKHVYLYHASRDQRHVFVLVAPDGAARAHIVDSAGLQQWPDLEHLYAERHAAMLSASKIAPGRGAFDYPSSLSAEHRVHTTERRALRAVADSLREIRPKGGSQLVVCSSRPFTYYDEHLGSAAEMPILMVPAARQEDALPALGWQLYSARRMVNCYLRSSQWVERWVELAAHLDVPLCNMGRDFAVFGADVDFARRLVANDMVLWWSPTMRPDLGGREADSAYGDEPEAIEITNPGAYRNVCLEVALGDLALNVVLQSSSVHAMEGLGSAAMAFDSASANLEDYSRGTVPQSADLGDAVLTAQTFHTVKSMVKSWYVEKTRAVSTYGALLADNFWRWACSPRSALFEPALQRFLQRLMRKTLLQLLAEFKRLGVGIVYASFSRLFLSTNKPTAGNAAAFGRYLMSAATSRELFRHVSLQIVHFWEYLMFLDIANFGGVICHEPDAAEPPEEFDIEMTWNIQEFLPKALQPRFSKLVGIFIYELFTAKRKALAASGGEPALNNADEPDEEANSALREIVGHSMTRRLLRAVQEIQNEIKTGAAQLAEGDAATRREYTTAWEFPQLPGSHLDLTNPALEFIKSITRVLALPRESAHEARVCRRNMLDLVGVREFATEAEWTNPCLPFRLPLVICQFCNDDRTMDLCRDADLIAAAGHSEWRCARCDFAYDRAAIETRLLTITQHYVAQYVMQDLRCSRCSRVKANNLAPYCECSGQWVQQTTRQDTLRRLQQARAIAEYYAFPILQANVATLLATA